MRRNEMKKARRNFLQAAGIGACTMLAASNIPTAARAADSMDALTALATRRSIREFTDQPVPADVMEKILQMAMLAPSAANEQPWEFIVIDDLGLLSRIADNIKYARFAANAPAAVLLCMDEEKQKNTGMGIIDMGTCAENFLLAAHALGLGATYAGVYPFQDRMKFFSDFFDLPANVKPIGLIVLGYPRTPRNNIPDRYNKAAVHTNKW